MYHDGNKIKAVDYKGGRTAKEIIEFGMDKAKALALKRIGAKPSAGASGSGGGGGGMFCLDLAALCSCQRVLDVGLPASLSECKKHALWDIVMVRRCQDDAPTWVWRYAQVVEAVASILRQAKL